MKKPLNFIFVFLLAFNLSSCAELDSFIYGSSQPTPASDTPVNSPYYVPAEQYSMSNAQVNNPYPVPIEQNPALNYPADDYYPAPVPQTLPVPVVQAPPPATQQSSLFGQSIFSFGQSIFSEPMYAAQKPKISVAQRNAVLESLTNHEWISVNKYNVSNKYLFRVDDNGLIVSYARLDTGEQSPEYYLYETPRGYQLDFPAMSAYLKFWLSESGALVRSVKVGKNPEDMYAMMPQERSEIYDDDIF